MKEHRPHTSRHWGGKIVVALVLGLLLTGVILVGTVMHTQLQWKQFQLDLALAISDLQREGGSLKATSREEISSVCPDNAYNLLKMLQTAKASSTKDVSRRNPAVEQLVLEFGTGEVLTISLAEQGTVHLWMELRNGGERTFCLGKCDFSKLKWIMSIEGAAYENAPWPE